MRRVAVIIALVAIGWVGIGARPAQAYYDDVHYALTYYVARRVGYTPEQAFRVASACASVDYSLGVDPVSLGPLGLIDRNSLNLATWRDEVGLDPVRSALLVAKGIEVRRVRFHAFYDEKLDPEAIGIVFDDVATDHVVNQLGKLKGKIAGNPGVSLHFQQDERSHLGYGSIHGTWPILDDQQIRKALEKRMPIGGSIDWLSFDRKDSMFASHPLFRSPNKDLVAFTATNLADFLDEHSPRQKSTRALPDDEVSRVLQQLQDANQAPRSLGFTDPALVFFPQPDLELAQFRLLYAKINADRIPDFLRFLFGLRDLNAPGPDLTEVQKEHFRRHILGPDLAAAMGVINAAMREAGMVEPSLPLPRRYPLDEEGRIADALADTWVLTGSLTVKVQVVGPVEVVVLAPPTMKGETEYELTKPVTPLSTLNVQFATWDNLPIGKVIVEVRRAGQRVVRQEVVLDKRRNETTVAVTDQVDWGGKWQVDLIIPQRVGEPGKASLGQMTLHRVTKEAFVEKAGIDSVGRYGGQKYFPSLTCAPDGPFYLGEYTWDFFKLAGLVYPGRFPVWQPVGGDIIACPENSGVLDVRSADHRPSGEQMSFSLFRVPGNLRQFGGFNLTHLTDFIRPEGSPSLSGRSTPSTSGR